MAHLELAVFFFFWRGAGHYYLGILFLYCRTPFPVPGATAGAPERENRLIWEHAKIVLVVVGIYSGKQKRFRDHSGGQKGTVPRYLRYHLPLRLYDDTTSMRY